MSSYLFVLPPYPGQAAAGHLDPAVSLGGELAARGHRVAYCGHPDVVPGLLPVGAAFVPVDSATPRLPWRGRRGPAVVRELWEDVYLPVAYEMVPGVEAAIEGFRPDALVVDQQALAGAAVATRRMLPWVTVMRSTTDVADPVASLPLVARWIRGLLGDLLTDVGVGATVTREVDPRFSPYLTIAFMAEALAPVSSCPRGVMFVGPHLGDGTDEHRGVQLHGAAGERLGLDLSAESDRTEGRGPSGPAQLRQEREATDGPPRPLVLLDPGPQPTLSTVRLLALASQALASMGARAALLTAESHRPALLRRASVVVSHGEQATVHEALAHGVPLVLVPLGGEQPIVAAAAESAHAAIRVGFRDLRVDDLRLAIESAILDPMVLAGALRVRDACRRGGGTHTAADRIEELSAENVTTLARRASA